MITCRQCLYWEPPLPGGGVGECRRNPPHACRRENPAWPETAADGWCGQATPRESGSTQPVHEAAQAVVEEWDPVGGWAAMERLREALRRMKP